MTAQVLVPSFVGHVKSTAEAILLFEGCLQGAISHVSRRPHDRERAHLIKSGNVFIYEENSSSIKRWTDGIPWSPSRILGNFLIYRELERSFPPGEKKRAMKRTSKKSPGISKTELGDPQSGNPQSAASALNSNLPPNDDRRALIGSLVDSYGFKEGGLVKKTLSTTVNGVSGHMVSYYNVDDVLNNRLSVPSKDLRLQNIIPRYELLHNQNFRASADETDSMDRMSGEDRTVYGGYAYGGRNGYEMTNQSFARPMPLPTLPQPIYSQYPPAPSSMYGYSASPHQSTPYSNPPSAPSAPGVDYAGYNVPTPGIYSRADSYEQSTARSRCAPNPAVGANGNRVTMPPASSFPRRSSSYEITGSFDSGVSVSSSTSDSKPSSSYTTQPPANFYDASRDAAHSYQSGQHRVLGPHAYEPRQSYPTPLFPMENKDAWSMQPSSGIGQNNLGNGHYVNPPQQWAGAVSN